ncbi:DUF3800 domain-containing protein [Dokdonella sp.]|uniref:DUF3800 domain-containing protein n=1 Tax=Dokdonella sp. TaxID=2291710 RepID=UPI003783F003
MTDQRHLFLDESGNTGVSLLDADQPVFSLASTTIARDIAAALIAPLLTQGQAEAKYSRLKNSARGRLALTALFSSPELDNTTTTFTVVDKRFYLIAQMVDKLIEPVLHEGGIDLYSRDAAVGMSNVWYYAGNYIFPSGAWDKLLGSLLAAIRRRTPDAFRSFDQVLADAAKRADRKYSDFLTFLMAARGRLNEFLGVYTEVETFDPAVDSFVLLVQDAMRRTSGSFPVTHDRSKPLAHTEPFLRALMKPDVTARKVGYGERKMELPLRISELSFADSRDHPQLQIADLLAGAAIDCLLSWSGRRPMSEYHATLQETRLASLFIGGLLPDPEIKAAPEPDLGDISIVDGQAQFLKDSGFFDRFRRET